MYDVYVLALNNDVLVDVAFVRSVAASYVWCECVGYKKHEYSLLLYIVKHAEHAVLAFSHVAPHDGEDQNQTAFFNKPL